MKSKPFNLLRNASYTISAIFMILALILWAIPTSTVQAGGPPGGGPPGGGPPGTASPTDDPCQGQPPGQCGTGDGGHGNPDNGSEHANCNAQQGEVDPDCETETPPATETPPVTETPPATETPPTTETPPSETETPPSETETPPSETETPPSETETPPSETETPPSETETPPSETETPVDDSQDPGNPRRPRVVGTPIAPPAPAEAAVLIPVTGIEDSPLAASLPQTFVNLSLVFFGIAMLLHAQSRRSEEAGRA